MNHTTKRFRRLLLFSAALGIATALGVMGRYGEGALNTIPEDWDLAAVIAFSLGVFYFAMQHAMSLEHIEESIAVNDEQLRQHSDLKLPG
jgi:hypothetical protein